MRGRGMTGLRLALLAGTVTAVPAAHAKDPSYIGTIDVRGIAGDRGTVTGTVFLDANRNARLDEGETGIAGVAVSNGREVVLTDDNGGYSLPARDDMNVMVTKPAGYATPVNERMVPQFAYIHKPEGTSHLRYGGIPDTGPLPAEINFPLVKDDSDRAAFNCLFFGDTQPYSHREVGYVRDLAGDMLAARDNADTECLIAVGDIAGDDLSLVPRLQTIFATGDTPVYGVPGNHDYDFDAASDADSKDTFRRQWGADYYSFDIGEVHFVVLDNVEYPCTGHEFCRGDEPTYNAVLTEENLTWLANDLAHVPDDKLIVLNQHIPLQTFTDNTAQKHQLDNLGELAALLEGRKVINMGGHTHTTESIAEGESFAGWEDNTGLAASPFHRQHIVGAVSGSWFSGALNDDGVPESYQRLGAPRGYLDVDFAGADYVDSYVPFHTDAGTGMHVAFNSQRFRDWAEKLIGYVEIYGRPSDVIPPVVLGDLPDPAMITRADLEAGTWAAVNVWNGGRETEVTVTINDGAPIPARRTQEGEGEEKRVGLDYADPYALLRQANDNRMAARSAAGSSGYEMWQGTRFEGTAGPLPLWMLTRSSSHLWRADLPTDLPPGVHGMTVAATDRHGRVFELTRSFEVVEALPPMSWQTDLWE